MIPLLLSKGHFQKNHVHCTYNANTIEQSVAGDCRFAGPGFSLYLAQHPDTNDDQNPLLSSWYALCETFNDCFPTANCPFAVRLMEPNRQRSMRGSALVIGLEQVPLWNHHR